MRPIVTIITVVLAIASTSISAAEAPVTMQNLPPNVLLEQYTQSAGTRVEIVSDVPAQLAFPVGKSLSKQEAAAFLRESGRSEAERLKMVLKTGFSTRYSDLFGPDPTPEQKLNRELFSLCFRVFVANGRTKEAAKALTELKASRPTLPAYAWRDFCGGLRGALWPTLSGNDVVLSGPAIADLWEICRLLHIMNQVKTAMPNEQEKARILRHQNAQTMMPSSLDLDAADALAMVCSYRSGAAEAFAKTFKQPEGEARKWWKEVTDRSLAKVYLKILPPNAETTAAEAREYIADFVGLRTHPVYATRTTASPRGRARLGFANDFRTGIELVVAAGPLAGESAGWSPSYSYTGEGPGGISPLGDGAPPGYKLDCPPLVDEAALWMLKAAEALQKLGRQEDATLLAKRLVEGSRNQTVRERAREIVEP